MTGGLSLALIGIFALRTRSGAAFVSSDIRES